MARRCLSDSLGRTWMTAVVTCFKVVYQHLRETIEKNHTEFVRIASLWAGF
jgi:hypothetical protein